jgi:hypothetical protein
MTPEQLGWIQQRAAGTLTSVKPWQERTATAGLAGQARDRAEDVLSLLAEVRRLRAAVDAALALFRHADERRLRAEMALRDLVDLKDGPRDAAYERRKPSAWEAARRALAPVAGPDPHTTSDEETPDA